MWEGFAGSAVGALANIGMGLYSAHQSAKEARAADKRAWRYYRKQKALDYQYDANQYFDLDTKRLNTDNQINYDLAKRYAENSAKWTVVGLRNAGLNPILAATDGNFRGTFGEGSTAQASRSSGSMPSGHQGNVPTVDVSGAASKLGNALVDFENKKKEGEVLESTKENIDANTAKAKAEEEKIRTHMVESPWHLGGYLLNAFKKIDDDEREVMRSHAAKQVERQKKLAEVQDATRMVDGVQLRKPTRAESLELEKLRRRENAMKIKSDAVRHNRETRHKAFVSSFD